MADTEFKIGCEDTHGNPFRYCSCGWFEETEPKPVPAVFTEADRVMIQEIHAVVKDLKDLGPQVMPVIESLQKHPMLKMLFK